MSITAEFIATLILGSLTGTIVHLSHAEPKPTPCSVRGIPATFTRVIDGDTFELQTHLGLGIHRDVTVRLLGIDTPEMRGLQRTAGVKARTFVQGWAKSYPVVVLYEDGPGKYGRLLARVCPPGEGQCLTEALVSAGHEKVKPP